MPVVIVYSYSNPSLQDDTGRWGLQDTVQTRGYTRPKRWESYSEVLWLKFRAAVEATASRNDWSPHM